MHFLTSTVGRKIVMAATGQLMIIFVLFHVAGNSTVYFDKLNAYAAGLHALPFLVWAVRLIMLAALSFHIYFAVLLKLENHAARPEPYQKKKEIESTFAGRNMVWTGAIIGTFLVYHLLHFTFQVIDPATAARAHLDTAGRPDVFLMVARGFQRTGIVCGYLFAVIALWFHLVHGIQSSFQTFGLNGDRSFPLVRRGSSLAALGLLAAYAAIPAVIFARHLLR
jgi:succinate dehydrogenase / fumarate reductase, cytochrome b subunit